MRISDWSSDVCSSDLLCRCRINLHALDKHRLRIETFVRHVQRDNIAGLDPDPLRPGGEADRPRFPAVDNVVSGKLASLNRTRFAGEALHQLIGDFLGPPSAVRRHIIRNGNGRAADRSEELKSELQSLMRISYAVFCLKKNNIRTTTNIQHIKAHKKYTKQT